MRPEITVPEVRYMVRALFPYFLNGHLLLYRCKEREIFLFL